MNVGLLHGESDADPPICIPKKIKMHIQYTELGNYLGTYNKQIIFKRTNRPLFSLFFDNEQLARTLVLEINRLYGEHLDWLGWSGWLSDIRQIHMGQSDRFQFGDFITELLKLNKTITEKDCIECWRRLRSD